MNASRLSDPILNVVFNFSMTVLYKYWVPLHIMSSTKHVIIPISWLLWCQMKVPWSTGQISPFSLVSFFLTVKYQYLEASASR